MYRLSTHKADFAQNMELMERYVLNGLHPSKCFEILNSNSPSDIFCTYQVKITFKHQRFVRRPYLTCCKRHMYNSLGFEVLIFLFALPYKGYD